MSKQTLEAIYVRISLSKNSFRALIALDLSLLLPVLSLRTHLGQCVLARTPGQCDQMAKLFLTISLLTAVQIGPKNVKKCQSVFKMLPNTK